MKQYNLKSKYIVWIVIHIDVSIQLEHNIYGRKI